MKNENLIHIKFDYSEALESKKEILFVEKSLMIMESGIKNYASLRDNELDSKSKLHKKMKELAANIRKLQKNLPEVEYSKKENNNNFEKDVKKFKKETRIEDNSIEAQLNEIQRKLNAIKG